MGRKIFGKNIKPACEYCAKGTLSKDETKVLCKRKGIMKLNSKCFRFKYDPLKRRPAAEPSLPEYYAEDFEL